MTERHESDDPPIAPLPELSTQDVADMLRVSDRTVQRLIKKGRLRAFRIAGSRITRIHRSDVEKLLLEESGASA